jgi:SMI1 / KNR4 family (SUKH-1)
MSEFNFLKQYIERLSEEERNDPFLGYKLGKGKPGLEVSQVESRLGVSVAEELKEFYEFSYGAELGEYKILSISEIANLISELHSRYEDNWKDTVLPFAYVKGVSDIVAFDLANSNEMGQILMVDGFHEMDPQQWKGICFGLRNWLIKMTENKFEPFWLKG